MRTESAGGAQKYSPSAKEASGALGLMGGGVAESSKDFSAHLQVDSAGEHNKRDVQAEEDSREEGEQSEEKIVAPNESSVILLLSGVPILPPLPTKDGKLSQLDEGEGDLPLIQSSIQITLQNSDIKAAGESAPGIRMATSTIPEFGSKEGDSLPSENSPFAVVEEDMNVICGAENSLGNKVHSIEPSSEQVTPAPGQLGMKQAANVAGNPAGTAAENLIQGGEQAPKPDKYRERESVIGRGTASAKALPGMTPELKSSTPELSNTVTDDSSDHLEPGTRLFETGAVDLEKAPTNSIEKDGSSSGFPAEINHRSVFTVHSVGSQQAAGPETGAQGSAAPSPTRFDSMFRALGEVGEKMRREGPGRVEVELQLDSGETVRVRLELQQGAVKAIFRTETGDFQQALQQGWANFSQQTSGRGFNMADASFETRSSNPEAAFDQEGKQNHPKDRQGEQGPSDRLSPSRQVSSGSGRTARPTGPGSLSLWA